MMSARDELVLEVGDARLGDALLLLGGMIFGILRQIAVGARFGDLLDDARALDGLEILDLSLKRSIALRGHRHLVHISRSSLGPPELLSKKCPV